MDFTLDSYQSLLKILQSRNYTFLAFNDFLSTKESKVITLRHDVDLLPQNSLRFAKIQSKLNIKGSYYFRAVPESWDEEIIKEITDLGHEVGYHYENMDTCHGDIDKAWDDFRLHLDRLRKLVDVNTICMHGSPRSKFDNKELWSNYDYQSLDIIGEPYYDVNFDEVFYLTDTGRRWDGWKSSVRDKVPQQEKWIEKGLVFHATNDIIKAFERNKTLSGVEMPDHIMFTMHPQRWNDVGYLWLKELVLQGIKNEVKKVLISKNK